MNKPVLQMEAVCPHCGEPLRLVIEQVVNNMDGKVLSNGKFICDHCKKAWGYTSTMLIDDIKFKK